MFDASKEVAQAIEAVTGFRPGKTIVADRMYRLSTSPKRNDTAGWCKLFLDDRAVRFAQTGHTLYQCGPVRYMAERWGMARHLPTLDDVEKFLLKVGGTGHEL